MSERDSHLVLLQCSQRFVDAVDKLVDVFEVFGHLSGEDHVYDGLPERAVLIPVRERVCVCVCQSVCQCVCVCVCASGDLINTDVNRV